MGITYGYTIPSIFGIIYITLSILLGILLFLAGRRLSEEEKVFNNSYLFKLAGILIIIDTIIFLAIPDIIDYSESDFQAVLFYYTTLMIISIIVGIIIFGIIFIKIGLANPEQNGKILFYSGVFWLIGYAINIVYWILNWTLFSGSRETYLRWRYVFVLLQFSLFFVYIVAFILFFPI